MLLLVIGIGIFIAVVFVIVSVFLLGAMVTEGETKQKIIMLERTIEEKDFVITQLKEKIKIIRDNCC